MVYQLQCQGYTLRAVTRGQMHGLTSHPQPLLPSAVRDSGYQRVGFAQGRAAPFSFFLHRPWESQVGRATKESASDSQGWQ